MLNHHLGHSVVALVCAHIMWIHWLLMPHDSREWHSSDIVYLNCVYCRRIDFYTTLTTYLHHWSNRSTSNVSPLELMSSLPETPVKASKIYLKS